MTGLSVRGWGGRVSAEARLATLLQSDAIDLAGISAAIRERPGLQRMVLTMSESLALAPTKPAGTVEEAAIVLGKNRLRVLVQAWSLVGVPDSVRVNAPIRNGEVTPEVLYLLSFFRWLGLDSAERPEHLDAPPEEEKRLPAYTFEGGEEVTGLTDMLMRDIVSLIPYVDPILPNQELKAAARAQARTREESSE
jgi:hypothetical protein